MTPGGRRDGPTSALLIVGLFVVVGAVVGGALALAAPPSGPTETPAPTAAAPAADASSAPSVAAGASASSAPSGPSAPSASSATASSSGLVAVVDPSLLRVLPATVAGVTVTEFPEAARQAVTDPDLGRNVSRVATAFVGDPGGANWAYTAVVDVRPEARNEAFYRDWQESFDQSACERAGGVTGHTTLTLAGRDVERTACGNGVRTYHVRIAGTGLLVSVSDLGPAKYGEEEIVNLRP